MQKMKIFLAVIIGMVLLVICSDQSYAQSSRSVEQVLEQRSANQVNKKKKKFRLFKKKKPAAKTDLVLREEYVKRMKSNARQKRREARLAKKPQYSDPSYFGHKRPPKKRPVGKRKFCKECGIVH